MYNHIICGNIKVEICEVFRADDLLVYLKLQGRDRLNPADDQTIVVAVYQPDLSRCEEIPDEETLPELFGIETLRLFGVYGCFTESLSCRIKPFRF